MGSGEDDSSLEAATKSRFSSKREKQLWIWALIVVIAIYSTLFLAGTLTEILTPRRLWEHVTFYSFLVVGLSVLGITLSRRYAVREVWIFIGIVALFSMVLARSGADPTHRTHLFEYTLLAVLVHEALIERRKNGRKVPYPSLLAMAITVSIGWIDEGIQAIVPNRVFDLVDIGMNTLAGIVGVGLSWILIWFRRKADRIKA